MNKNQTITKAELLAEIDRDWTALNTLLDGLTEAQLIDMKNAEGWAVKDHMAHLAAWERSVIVFLEGRPRYEGLGISEANYLNEDIDIINDYIFKLHQHKTLAEVQQVFQQTHQHLLRLIAPLSDADLQQSYAHFLPDEPGESEGPPAIILVYNNTADHYRDHQLWIEEQLNL